MPVYPSELPVLLALVWPNDGFHLALMVGALASAVVLSWLALRDRRRRVFQVAPLQLAPHPRRFEFPRVADHGCAVQPAAKAMRSRFDMTDCGERHSANPRETMTP